MPVSAYTLFGELKGDTTSFKNAMLSAHAELEATKIAIDSVERRAIDLGKTTAVVGRQFDKLRENVAATQQRLNLTAEAFQRGEATAGQMRAALVGVDRATAQLNSRLADSNARLTDYKNKINDIRHAVKNMASGMQAAGQALAASLTLPLTALGAAAIKSASNIDTLRNKLTAATGSVEAAEAKLKELRQLAQDNAGVFSNSAADLFAYFKAMQVGDETINNLIKAFGRLSLANEGFDTKEFARNLSQLFDQKFEMSDLKQAIGVFPQFGQIAQKAFGLTSSSLDEVQKGLQDLVVSGKLTKEEFLRLFAAAVQGDAVFSKLTDTVGIRFSKMLERISISLQPLGQTILNALEPIINFLIPMIERLGQWFASLSPTIQTAIVGFLAFAAALGPVLLAAGAVIGAIITIGGAIASAVAAVGGLTVALPILAGFILFLGEIAAAAVLLHKAWETNFGGIREKTAQVWEFVKAATTAAIEEIQAIINLGSKIINGDWSGAWDAFLEIIKIHTKHLVTALRNVLPVLAQWGLSLVRTLGEWAIKAGAFVIDIFTHLPQYLLALTREFVKAGFEIGNAIWQGVKDGLKQQLPGATGPSLADLQAGGFGRESILDKFSKAAGLDKLKEAVANMPAIATSQTPAFAGVPVGAPQAAIASASDGGMLAGILTEIQAFHKSVVEGKGSSGKLEVSVKDEANRVQRVSSPTPETVSLDTFGFAGGFSNR